VQAYAAVPEWLQFAASPLWSLIGVHVGLVPCAQLRPSLNTLVAVSRTTWPMTDNWPAMESDASTGPRASVMTWISCALGARPCCWPRLDVDGHADRQRAASGTAGNSRAGIVVDHRGAAAVEFMAVDKDAAEGSHVPKVRRPNALSSRSATGTATAAAGQQ